MSTVVNLRSEVFALERELTKQKVKCRALEEELQNPLNIHRWRKLEASGYEWTNNVYSLIVERDHEQGTDPHTYDLIVKIQQLQKRVLTKSEIAAEKDLQLKELESLYDSLKTTMANLSPTEITNRIFALRKESEEKSKKIKVGRRISQVLIREFSIKMVVRIFIESDGRNEYV